MTGDNTLIHSHGINRRDFMKLCAALAATMGLSSKAAAEMLLNRLLTRSVRQLSGLARRSAPVVRNLCFVQRIQR